jgi:hypothetical protein
MLFPARLSVSQDFNVDLDGIAEDESAPRDEPLEIPVKPETAVPIREDLESRPRRAVMRGDPGSGEVFLLRFAGSRVSEMRFSRPVFSLLRPRRPFPGVGEMHFAKLRSGILAQASIPLDWLSNLVPSHHEQRRRMGSADHV